ncbi:MAG: class I SAM-dependent methyltransferase [Promethearchaeota archaeon]|nr:MAG: class I SAM-dependent methyltransferase [Candidatus Lokiarchaeota archaeon]
MEKKIDAPNQNSTFDISNYICLSAFRKSLFNRIIKSLNLPYASKGLDAGCGIGYYTKIIADFIGEKGSVIGVDISNDFISYADKNHAHNVYFEEGNLNSLRYEDDFFDWIWSADTVWPGPKDLGCPAEDPTNIIKGFYRILKPGGVICLLFWSTQKFLPGYPLLEARLNTSEGANAPFINGMNPDFHVMNAKLWLYNSGFKNLSAKTYIENINAPLDETTLKALQLFFQMLWGESENYLSKSEWKKFKRLSSPKSSDYILNNPHYHGFYTYTLFQGIK